MLKSRIHFLDEKLRAFLFSNLENLRAISPSEMAQKFLDGKGVSAPQKLGDFSKKWYQKTMISAAKILKKFKILKVQKWCQNGSTAII